MYAGSYGLTAADGPAQQAGSARSQAGAVTWPVRAGLVPPLADGFVARPETVPGLEAALVPGAAVALVPGQADREQAGRAGVIREDPARGRPGRVAVAVAHGRPAGLGECRQPGLDPVRLRPGRRAARTGSRA